MSEDVWSAERTEQSLEHPRGALLLRHGVPLCAEWEQFVSHQATWRGRAEQRTARQRRGSIEMDEGSLLHVDTTDIVRVRQDDVDGVCDALGEFHW